MEKTQIIIRKNCRAEYKKVTPRMAEIEMKGIIPKGYKLREYCENCGILFGEQFINKKPVMFKTFFVCQSCKDDLERELKTGQIVSTPNLNDL